MERIAALVARSAAELGTAAEQIRFAAWGQVVSVTVAAKMACAVGMVYVANQAAHARAT